MNLILISYFTKIKDPQRDIFWEADPEKLQPLIDSLNGRKLVLFTDSLKIKNKNIEVIQIENKRNPYYQRWLSYYDYLIKTPDIGKVFCVDSTDVVMLQDPFKKMDDEHIYVGDENSKLGEKWMAEAHPKLARIFNDKLTMLNIGLLGGSVELIIPLLFDFKILYMIFGDNLGKTEMAAFNFLLHTKYSDIVKHGTPINTIFNKQDMETDAWWRHK